MAWYSRPLSAASRALRRVGQVFTGRPAAPPTVEQPPQPVTQGTYDLPSEPVTPAFPTTTPESAMGLPPEAPMQPADTGTWVSDEPPRGDEFTVYDPRTFDPIQTDTLMTADDWYRESLMPADYLRSRYDWADENIVAPNIEILLQLELEGYDIDWDDWRDRYEAVNG